jgi:hypothetical protein
VSVHKTQVSQDRAGCGIACVAHLLNTTYCDAKKTFHRMRKRREIKGNEKTYGYSCNALVAVLNNRGLKYSCSRPFAIATLPPLSVCYCHPKTGGKNHFIARSKRSMWFDPDCKKGLLKNFPKKHWRPTRVLLPP